MGMQASLSTLYAAAVCIVRSTSASRRDEATPDDGVCRQKDRVDDTIGRPVSVDCCAGS
jgi:hypothetical protein